MNESDITLLRQQGVIALVPYQAQTVSKIRTGSPGNHHTIGITAHVDCTEHTRVCKTSYLPGVQLPGVPILRKEMLPNTFLKHPVEIWGVLI